MGSPLLEEFSEGIGQFTWKGRSAWGALQLTNAPPLEMEDQSTEFHYSNTVTVMQAGSSWPSRYAFGQSVMCSKGAPFIATGRQDLTVWLMYVKEKKNRNNKCSISKYRYYIKSLNIFKYLIIIWKTINKHTHYKLFLNMQSALTS